MRPEAIRCSHLESDLAAPTEHDDGTGRGRVCSCIVGSAPCHVASIPLWASRTPTHPISPCRRTPARCTSGSASADTMQPASANTALIEATNALDKGEAEIHDGADHGFGVYGPALHDAAATRSYERAKVMFDRELHR